MSEYGIGQLGGLQDVAPYGQYEDADLPDAPKEPAPEEAPEKDPEVQKDTHYTEILATLTILGDSLNRQLVEQSERIDTLTGAVNQFGGMLDYIVQSVSAFGKQISEGGISGIMGMLKGGGVNNGG